MKKHTVLAVGKAINIVAIIALAIWGVYLLAKGKALCLSIISASLALISPLIKNRIVRILSYIVATICILLLAWMAIKGYLTYH